MGLDLMLRPIALGLISVATAVAIAQPAASHDVAMRASIQVQTAGGTTATYTHTNLPPNSRVTAVVIEAYYSTGELMSDGTIQIFAPGRPDVPWRTGRLNSQGRYQFVPDLSQRGRWTVRVESPGHSDFINLVL
jgi:nickel transport protein